VLPGAIGALLIALISFIFENRFIFFLFPLGAIGIAIATGLTVIQNKELRKDIGWRVVPTLVIDAFAILLAVVSLLFSILARFE
jgi:hypothetical protein